MELNDYDLFGGDSEYDDNYCNRPDHGSMNDTDYKEEIEYLLSTCVTNHGEVVPWRMEPLLKALGCRSVRYSGRQCYVQRPAQPPKGHEDIITSTLVSALQVCLYREPYDESSLLSILDGLSQKNRWRACLSSEEDSRMLAASLILFFAGIYDHIEQDADKGALGLVLMPGPLALLNKWTSPAIAYDDNLLAEDVARSLFGDAWYQLVASGASKWNLAQLVLEQQPSFLPNILSFKAENAGMMLPTLEGPY
jgi:hypothetical protein